MKHFICSLLAIAAVEAVAAPPMVGNVSVVAQGRRLVVTYDLSSDAVVTADALTNDTVAVFASVGAAFRSVTGDVWRVVSAGSRSFVWRIGKDLPGQSFPAGSLKVQIKAWALDDKPDYMIVDLETGATTYYPSVGLVPGGILDEAYRTEKLAMRRIHARGIEWQMGCYGEYGNDMTYETIDRAHFVTLDHDYYIGVFEMTQGQVGTVRRYTEDKWKGSLPHSNARFVDVRRAHYPEEIPSDTDLGAFRERTGLDFDLPSEAEWEYACRAGHGEDEWGDGSPILDNASDTNLGRLAHFGGNNGPGGWSGAVTNTGSKAANDWGLYDMYGNVRELCLDWFQTNITWNATGAPNSSGNACLDGAVRSASSPVVVRGGGYASYMKDCRAAHRESQATDAYQSHTGWRIVCRNGL